mmetsp:Transcript_10820/g.25625  ORF Transcript_10820/g.25625 Transcript_10820/m.25625 type:complete len:234 (+) Transcript_10820:148-849(+)
MSQEATESITPAAESENNDNNNDDDDEEDLEKLQKEIERMEAEAARITKETDDLEKKKEGEVGGSGGGDTKSGGGEASVPSENRDGASIYVGQVDYGTTPEELLGHFEACGTVERVTIVCDKYTGKPKGYAYLEFQSEASVENAIKLDGSEFKGRNLKVTAKRVNVAGYHYQQAASGAGGEDGGRGGRGGGRGFYRGGRGGRGRGGYHGRGGYRGGYRGGRGGRGRGYHHPYY